MRYQDFVLLLDLTSSGRVRARVIQAPGGEGEAELALPLAAEDRERLEAFATGGPARGATAGVETVQRGFRPVNGAIHPEMFLEELGGRLFEGLFSGSVRTAWDRSLGVVGPGGGLRLKLQMSLEDAPTSVLHEIPWEYLYSAANGGYLSQQRRTPVVRHLRVLAPTSTAPALRILRVLAVSCQPERMTPLALEREHETLERTWGRTPGVEVIPLVQPSLEAVRQHLLRHEIHVLHFMGHGGFEGEGGRGELYFVDEDGDVLPISGKLLASHLRGFPSLRLVFLNACDTARAGGAEPLAGVATALVAAGIPAVVAMQMPVPDAVALTFSRAVYRRLAEGDAIGAAVSEGRLAIAGSRAAPGSWGIPVLFLRAGDDELFARSASIPGAEPTPRSPVSPDPAATAPGPRSHRMLISILVTLAVSVAGVTAGLRLWPSFQAPEPVQQKEFNSETTKPEETKPAQQPENAASEPAKPAPVPTSNGTKPRVTPAVEPPLSTQASNETPAQEKAGEALSLASTSKPDPPPSNGPVIVSANGSVYLPAMKARVSVRFFEQAGHQFARFYLSPEGEGMLQQPPVMGMGPITFTGAKGTYVLEVLNLDFEGEKAEVQGSR